MKNDYCEIALSGKRAHGRTTIVSAADAPVVSEMSLSVSGPSGSPRPYVMTGRLKYLHRVLTGAGPDQDVDHINGDTLDNRRENLRVVSRSKNLLASQFKKPGCFSRFRGVCRATKRGRVIGWQAGISIKRKRKHLGTFKTERAARDAYEKARMELLSI